MDDENAGKTSLEVGGRENTLLQGSVADLGTEKLKTNARNAVTSEGLRKEYRGDTGKTEPKKPAPKELPRFVFKAIGKGIGCDKMELDTDEENLMAVHFGNIIGDTTSKIYSVFIISLVFISKLGTCWKALKIRLQEIGGKS